MNRGINKEPLSEPDIKGKSTRANPIRIVWRVPHRMEVRITVIAEAMQIETAAAVRMLMWFSLRFSTAAETRSIAREKPFKADGQATHPMDTRITQEMADRIENLMQAENISKSNAIKTLLYWALENIGNYTIQDFISE